MGDAHASSVKSSDSFHSAVTRPQRQGGKSHQLDSDCQGILAVKPWKTQFQPGLRHHPLLSIVIILRFQRITSSNRFRPEHSLPFSLAHSTVTYRMLLHKRNCVC